jgi:Domain of unknown function (DUF4136)
VLLARFRGLAVLLSLILLTIAADTQTIRVQWEPGTDFSKYQSFAWVTGQAAVDPEAGRFIRESVENALSQEGIFPNEDNPDLHVAYYASAKEVVEVTGGYSSNWTEADAILVNRYTAGTLVIDLVDASENRLLWRATANATITGDPKKSRYRIPQVVQKMFTDFPPQK